MPKIKNLVKLKLIIGILMTVANHDQHESTKVLNQVRIAADHGNARCHELENSTMV